MPIDYSAFPATASPGSRVILEATGDIEDVTFQWIVPSGTVVPNDGSPKVTWNIPPRAKPGAAEIGIVPTTTVKGGEDPDPATLRIELTKAPLGPGDRLNFPEGAEDRPLNVSLRRSSIVDTTDQGCTTSSAAALPGCRSSRSSVHRLRHLRRAEADECPPTFRQDGGRSGTPSARRTRFPRRACRSPTWSRTACSRRPPRRS